MGKELAAAAISRLYLIDDEHGGGVGTYLTQLTQEFVRGQLYAANALYALDDHGAHIAPGQLATHGLDVVEREIDDLESVIYRRNDFGVVGHIHGGRSTAVERVRKRDDFLLSRVERGQLQGILIGFGARIDEEEAVIVVTRRTAQLLGQLGLQLVDHRIGIEGQPVELRREFLDIIGVGVPYRNHGVAAVKVEIFITLVVINMTPFSLHDIDVEERIYIK